MPLFPEPHPSFPPWSRYLTPLSTVYAALVSSRIALYRNHVLPQVRLSRPVISVGNIVLGGTGKTPTIASLARAIVSSGRFPCLLTRGHGRVDPSRALVSIGDGAQVSAGRGGDEPVLLAKLVPRLAIISDRRRASAGRWAEEHLRPDVFLLDDGFQHLPLVRDRDLVLLSSRDPLGGNALPPRGLLREPPSALARATDVAVLAAENEDAGESLDLARRLAPSARHFVARRSTTGPFLPNGSPKPVEELSRLRLLAVSGVARNSGASEAMRRAGLPIVSTLEFPDHHRYTPDDFDHIGRVLDREKLDGVITTGKDGVKFTPDVGFPWWWIDVEIEADWAPILDVLTEWEVQA